MTTEDTRAQKRKMAVKLLAKIYEDDIECLAAIHTAEANENWGLIYNALESTATFITELKRAIR
jgi:hypothetical protein